MGILKKRGPVQVVPGSVATGALEDRLAFLKRVYAWMAAALVVTGAAAMISIHAGWSLALLRTGFVGGILLLVGWIGLAFAARAVRHKPTVNVIVYALYAFFTGIVISQLILVALFYAGSQAGSTTSIGGLPVDGRYVYLALGLTIVVFGALSIYTFFTKRDFSWMRGLLFVGLIGIIVAGLLNWLIFQSIGLGMVISAFGVLIFAGYILYDTQRILKTYPNNEHVAASLELFLDFVMLFMQILRLILYIAAFGDD